MYSMYEPHFKKKSCCINTNFVKLNITCFPENKSMSYINFCSRRHARAYIRTVFIIFIFSNPSAPFFLKPNYYATRDKGHGVTHLVIARMLENTVIKVFKKIIRRSHVNFFWTIITNLQTLNSCLFFLGSIWETMGPLVSILIILSKKTFFK